MVAKAATRAGEFFCFHCGKQVKNQDAACDSCGSEFDKVTEAFRCPRCSNLLPIGAAACPACGLGFKVRTISSTSKITEDDKFLMKLIDWGKQGETPPPKPQVSRTVKTPPPPPPIMTRKVTTEPAKPTTSLKVQARSVPVAPKRPVAEVPKELPKEIPREAIKEAPKEPVREQPKEAVIPPISAKVKASSTDLLADLEEAEEDLRHVTVWNMRIVDALRKHKEGEDSDSSVDTEALYEQLQTGMRDIDNLQTRIRQMRQAAVPADPVDISTARVPAATLPEDHGLSNQALKKLLEEREREVGSIKEREEEIARKEEHLNRKIRAYAVKKKELDELTRQVDTDRMAAKQGGVPEELDFPAELVVDDKNQWMKEQSRIKNGLIEIRSQIAPKKDSMDYAQQQLSSDVAEKMEILEEKLVGVTKERDELSARMRKLEDSEEDVKTLLKVLDQLLGKLPPETIDEFSKSKDFKLYEKVLDELNI